MSISPTFVFELLKILPGVIAEVDPKKKDKAKLLDAIFKLPDMFGGAFKSSSTGTSTTTEGTDLRNPLTIDGVDQGIFSSPGNILRIPGVGNSIFNV